jgi:hypothetical protein
MWNIFIGSFYFLNCLVFRFNYIFCSISCSFVIITIPRCNKSFSNVHLSVSDVKMSKKGKLNSEQIWKIWKKGGLNSEMIWKICEKSKLKCEISSLVVFISSIVLSFALIIYFVLSRVPLSSLQSPVVINHNMREK